MYIYFSTNSEITIIFYDFVVNFMEVVLKLSYDQSKSFYMRLQNLCDSSQLPENQSI